MLSKIKTRNKKMCHFWYRTSKNAYFLNILYAKKGSKTDLFRKIPPFYPLIVRLFPAHIGIWRYFLVNFKKIYKTGKKDTKISKKMQNIENLPDFPQCFFRNKYRKRSLLIHGAFFEKMIKID